MMPPASKRTTLPFSEGLSHDEKILIYILKAEYGPLLHECTTRRAKMDWNNLIHLAKIHCVAPLVYRQMKQSDEMSAIFPDQFFERLRLEYLLNLAQNIKRYHELSKVLKLLEREQVPVILLKGAHLASHVYDSIGTRTMSDVDILVKKGHLAQAEKVLLQKGYYPNSEHITLDIHWNLSLYLGKFNIDMKGVWERAQTIPVDCTIGLGLSPEDLILHLCLHCCFHHDSFQFAGLRTLCDIRESVNRYSHFLNWEKLGERALQWGIGNAVFLTLLLAKDILSAKIPQGFFTYIKPNDYDSHLLDWSKMRVMQGPMESIGLSPYFWQLWAPIPLRKKASGLIQLLVPPPEFITQKYPAPHRTFSNYFHYIIRLKDNFYRYLKMTLRILTHENQTKSMLNKKVNSLKLTEWLMSQ